MRVGDVRYKPIGLIRSEHLKLEETPIQPNFARGCRGEVVIYPEFEEGLKDIEGFSHIYLVCHLHRSRPAKMLVKPFMQNQEKGLFSTRSPNRPNPIGISLVELETRVGNVLYVNGLDILDGTPVLDIKPFSSRLSEAFRSRDGWMEEVDPDEVKARGGRTPDRDPNQTQRTGKADDWKELETGGERPPSGSE